MPVRRDRRVHHLNRRGEEIATCLARSARQTTPPRATQSQAEDMMNCNAAVLTPVARFRDGKHVSFNLMPGWLLLEQFRPHPSPGHHRLKYSPQAATQTTWPR